MNSAWGGVTIEQMRLHWNTKVKTVSNLSIWVTDLRAAYKVASVL